MMKKRYKTKSMLILLFSLLLPLPLLLPRNPVTIDMALKAYQEMDFDAAGKISEQLPGDPLASLVHNLCQVHDSKKGDLKQGLSGLKKRRCYGRSYAYITRRYHGRKNDQCNQKYGKFHRKIMFRTFKSHFFSKTTLLSFFSSFMV